MKKSILIGALAALMLFAFVACDNSTATGFDQLVMSISVTGTPTYFVGEEADLSDYTVTATTFAGSTFTVDSEDLSWASATHKAALGDEEEGSTVTVGTIKYDGLTYSEPVTAEAKAVVYTLDKFEVVGPASAEVYYGVPELKNFNYTAYKATASALDDNDAVLYSREIANATEEAPKGYTVALTKGESETITSSTDYTGAATATFTYLEETDTADLIIQKNYIESFEVKVANAEAPVIIGAVAGDAEDWITVTATYANGHKGAVTASADNTKWADGALDDKEEHKDAPVFTSNDASIVVTLPTGRTGVATEKSISLDPVTDYVTEFKVTYDTSKAVTAGRSLYAADFGLTEVTWASTKKGNENLAEIKVEDLQKAVKVNGLSEITVPSYLESGDDIVVTITIDGQSKAKSVIQTLELSGIQEDSNQDSSQNDEQN